MQHAKHQRNGGKENLKYFKDKFMLKKTMLHRFWRQKIQPFYSRIAKRCSEKIKEDKTTK